jgi:hypothetical protein
MASKINASKPTKFITVFGKDELEKVSMDVFAEQ